VKKKIMDEIIKAKKIAIIPHISADGDALGSSFGLALGLKKLNKDVEVFLEEEVPTIYKFMPGLELEKEYTFQSSYYDLVIAIDVGDVSRLGERSELLNNGRKTVNIDHHKTNTLFAFYNLVDSGISSVGEMIYTMLVELGVEINKDIATCLYIAISADTGGFRYSNTTSATHKVISEIVSFGVDIADISKKIFDNVSFQKLKLVGKAVDSIELIENGKIAVIVISDKGLNISGLKDEDYDGIVNLGRNIEGVEVSILFREKPNGEIKINLRSNYYVDVSKLANMYMGGGHKRAAGCVVKGELKKMKKQVLEDLISEM